MFTLILSFLLSAAAIYFIWRTTVMDEYFFSQKKMAEKRFAFVLAFLQTALLGVLYFTYIHYQNSNFGKSDQEALATSLIGIFMLLGCINYKILLHKPKWVIEVHWKILRLEIMTIANAIAYMLTIYMIVNFVVLKWLPKDFYLFQLIWSLFYALILATLFTNYIPFLNSRDLGGVKFARGGFRSFFRKRWYLYLPFGFLYLYVHQDIYEDYGNHFLFFDIVSFFTFCFGLRAMYVAGVYRSLQMEKKA